jgi:hypothetical protein
VFGFIGEEKYSYCPSVLEQEDGSVVIFFCGMQISGVMVDNIYQITLFPNGTKSKAESVLQPGENWDSHHTCDPCVIEGKFLWNNTEYKYAMFYLSNMLNVYYNEIGVAFSNDLNSNSWIKYPEQLIKKTWDGELDQSLGNNNFSWGVGQPSAVSLDKKGKILLTYTIGDIGGTRIVWREIDLSNVNNVKIGNVNTMVKAGLLAIDNKSNDYTCNSDFAINLKEDKIIMIRPVQPHPTTYPSYIPVAQEINYMNLSDFMANKGKWEKLYRLTSADSNFPRNHNSAILRDNYGHITNWRYPTYFFSVSKASPDVSPATHSHAEWTYHIYKSTLKAK